MKPLTPPRALAMGAVTIAVLEGALAMVRSAAVDHTPPIRVLQAVASGVIGQRAFTGGLPTALFGLGLHLLIATMIMLVYLAATRRVPALHQHAVLYGSYYGVAVYLVMFFGVLPLSLVSRGPLVASRVLPALVIHIVGVGIPAALIARRVRGVVSAG